jgi:hypothetical protein
MRRGDGVTLLAPAIDTMRSHAGVTPGHFRLSRSQQRQVPPHPVDGKHQEDSR